MANVHGNTKGLKASALSSAERLYRRRVRPDEVFSNELAAQMCDVSFETRRQVGVLLDRRGQPEYVIVGDARKLWLPDVGRMRAGRGRLRGLRLVHTHVQGEGLSNDDLTDLALLRLDLVAAITLTLDGRPGNCHMAHLLPDESSAQPWRVLEPQPVRDVVLNPIELVRSLEEEFARASRALSADDGKDRAVIVHLTTKQSRRSEEACLAELGELCRTAGVVAIDCITQRRQRPDPRYAVGRGKLDEILLRANQLGAELLIFDPDLTPAQARAITDATDLKVLDRTMLILDIFAQHANSRDGKLQVELAQLRYSLPRLVAKNTMLSRLTGGIGGRGPGETKLEINRRRARERIARLERQLRTVTEQRKRRRSLRQRRRVPIVSIVGYTNAGKSTLLNTLTAAQSYAEDALFATLDPLSRRVRFPRERELLLTDTVGFIHDLPEDLINAFRATLEELTDADLFIHVVDISDGEFRSKIDAVEQIIAELGVSDTPAILALNKIDQLPAEEVRERTQLLGGTAISAFDSESTRPLLAEIEELLWREDRLPAGHSDVVTRTVSAESS